MRLLGRSTFFYQFHFLYSWLGTVGRWCTYNASTNNNLTYELNLIDELEVKIYFVLTQFKCARPLESSWN